MSKRNDRPAPSDALLLFGVSGDLAHKMIFPALYEMVRRRALTVPVVGVASTPWTVAQLRERATDSIRKSGIAVDRRVLERLLALLRYVPGDYNDAATYAALKRASGTATAPCALPRHPAVAVRDCHRGTRGGRAGGAGAGHRREAVRARPGLGATAQRRRAIGVPRECDLPDRSFPGEGGDHEHPVLPVRQRLPRAHLEPQLRGERPDHPGGAVRRARPRRVLRDRRAACAT